MDGGQADLVAVTTSGYLTEFEIKTSLADWNHDQFKDKWAKPRPHISRFFYVVPEVLVAKEPFWVPRDRGLLAVFADRHGRHHLRTVRAAKRVRSKKIEPTGKIARAMNEAYYFRFWRNYLDETRRRYDRKRREQLAVGRPGRDGGGGVRVPQLDLAKVLVSDSRGTRDFSRGVGYGACGPQRGEHGAVRPGPVASRSWSCECWNRLLG